MPEGQPLEFSGLTKRFGAITAVSSLTARVEPGMVTGFLGPNGAGKTTTLRILLGLARASEGTATIGGKAYRSLERPMQTVGAVLESSSFHPGRSGANHLKVYAQAAGLPASRVDEVLSLVGLMDAAGRNVGGYSLGMRQRLGLATALLGDPGVLVLDEPTNGLDPEGIRWIRGFLQQLAREGRTVLVSSHLLAEVQQTVDSLLIISHGRLVFQGGLDELSDPTEHATVVDAPDRAALTDALRAAGADFQLLRTGLTVPGLSPTDVGRIAADAGIALSSLLRRGPALEEVFLDLANGTRVHPSAGGVAAGVSEPEAAVEPEPDTEAEAEAPVEPEPEAPIESEPEPDAAVESVVADVEPDVDPDVESEEAPIEPRNARAGAGFAVASTGVIDVIPVPVEEAAPDHADDTPDSVAERAEDDLASEVPSDLPDDDDDILDAYVRTDADEDADRFFAAFDDSAEPGDSAPDDSAPVDDTPAPDEQHPDTDDEEKSR